MLTSEQQAILDSNEHYKFSGYLESPFNPLFSCHLCTDMGYDTYLEIKGSDVLVVEEVDPGDRYFITHHLYVQLEAKVMQFSRLVYSGKDILEGGVNCCQHESGCFKCCPRHQKCHCQSFPAHDGRTACGCGPCDSSSS